MKLFYFNSLKNCHNIITAMIITPKIIYPLFVSSLSSLFGTSFLTFSLNSSSEIIPASCAIFISVKFGFLPDRITTIKPIKGLNKRLIIKAGPKPTFLFLPKLPTIKENSTQRIK